MTHMVKSEATEAVIRRELVEKRDQLAWAESALTNSIAGVSRNQNMVDALRAEIRDLEEELPAPIVEDATAPLGFGEWMF